MATPRPPRSGIRCAPCSGATTWWRCRRPGSARRWPTASGRRSDDYLAWLVGELEALDGPIDLVGHDWGGGHVQRLAATRPDLIRSWVTDIAGAADPDYVWHDLAQVWQTPGDGEAARRGDGGDAARPTAWAPTPSAG